MKYVNVKCFCMFIGAKMAIMYLRTAGIFL